MVLQFLDRYSSSHTIKMFRYSLRRFFEVIYGQTENLESLAERYMTEDRNYQDDVEKFFISMKSRPPKSIRLLLSHVKTFLRRNKKKPVELPTDFWEDLTRSIRGSRARTIDRIPSNAELKRLITYMGLNGKALCLVLASSGMRIGECLKLKESDLDLKKDPVRVNIRGELTKSGNSRFAFISSEAKEYLTQWLKQKEDYLKTASKRSRHKKSSKDDRIFPFTHPNVSFMWNNALEKNGLDERDSSTDRRKIHLHTLRKFFRTRLGSVIPVDIVEALMGHEGYLTEVYRRHTPEELAKFYKEGEHVLTIFSNIEKVAELKKEIEQKNNELQTLVNGLTVENLRLKADLRESNKRLSDLEATTKELIQNVKQLLKASRLSE